MSEKWFKGGGGYTRHERWVDFRAIMCLVLVFAEFFHPLFVCKLQAQQPAATATQSGTVANGNIGKLPFDPQITPQQADDNLRTLLGIMSKKEEADGQVDDLRDYLHAAQAAQGERRGLLAKGHGFSAEIKNEIATMLEYNAELKQLGEQLTEQLEDLMNQIKEANGLLNCMTCQLQRISCTLNAVNSILCSLPGKIRRAKVRAFIFGFILGLGLGIGLAGAGGGGAAASAAFFCVVDDLSIPIPKDKHRNMVVPQH